MKVIFSRRASVRDKLFAHFHAALNLVLPEPFSYTVTMCFHMAFSSMVVSSQIYIPIPTATHLSSTPPFLLILDQVDLNVASYLMGMENCQSHPVPHLSQFLATNKIRLSVSHWFGKTRSAGRYHNHIIQI